MEISVLKNALPVGVRAEGTARLESSLWILLSKKEQCLRATPSAVGGSLGSHSMGLPHCGKENLIVVRRTSTIILFLGSKGNS